MLSYVESMLSAFDLEFRGVAVKRLSEVSEETLDILIVLRL